MSSDIIFDTQISGGFLDILVVTTLRHHSAFVVTGKLHTNRNGVVFLRRITSCFLEIQLDRRSACRIDLRICQLISLLFCEFQKIDSELPGDGIEEVLPSQTQGISNSSCHVAAQNEDHVAQPLLIVTEISSDLLHVFNLKMVDFRLLAFLLVLTDLLRSTILFQFRFALNDLQLNCRIGIASAIGLNQR